MSRTTLLEAETGDTVQEVAASDAVEEVALNSDAIVENLDGDLEDRVLEPAVEIPCGSFHLSPPDDTVAAPKPGGLAYRAVKRCFDLVFSLVVVIILAVPVILLCLAISVESRGMPIFRQERIGLNGKAIKIFKLRTMVSDAHSNPRKYLDDEQMEHWRREQKVDNDPRVTKIGKWLRRFSLDELPQFLNVLIGDLSVIGPRPVTEEETWEYGEARELVLSVKPGITGWWQVTARNGAGWGDGTRQALEVFYARHASFALDVRVFVRTFKAMKKGQ